MTPSLRETTVGLNIAVIGGGPGGISAAIAAARSGARTVLVERTAMFDGVAACALGILGFLERSGSIARGGPAQGLIGRPSTVGGSPGHGKLRKVRIDARVFIEVMCHRYRSKPRACRVVAKRSSSPWSSESRNQT